MTNTKLPISVAGGHVSASALDLEQNGIGVADVVHGDRLNFSEAQRLLDFGDDLLLLLSLELARQVFGTDLAQLFVRGPILEGLVDEQLVW